MIALAEIERRIRGLGELWLLDQSHLHRATRQDDWGIAKTRDNLRAQSLAAIATEGLGDPIIEADLGDMIAYRTAGGWCEHRWARREGGRIAAETLIVDGSARARALGRDPAQEAMALAAAAPVHGPLGELRSGQGQLPGALEPLLPHDFPEGALPAARRLHRLWHLRALDAAVAEWRGPAEAPPREAVFVAGICAGLPDAALMIERGLVRDNLAAVLWRLHGHDSAGVRIRAIGSSVARLEAAEVVAETTLIDTLSIAAQPLRPLINY